MKTMLRVSELAQEAKSKQEPLLSRYNAAFWQPYLLNFSSLDRLFESMYRSFKYFVYKKNVSVADALPEFTEDVKALLFANTKKYNEMFRLENLDDEVYNILDNYDLTETMSKVTGNKRTENIGAREDSDTLTMTGTNTHAINETATNEQTGNVDMKHSGTDTSEKTGTETDALTGTDKTTVTETITNNYGAVASDSTTNNPDITTTRENTVSAFDETDYSPREKSTETVNKHAIDTMTNTDEHTDTASTERSENLEHDTTDTKTYNVTDTNTKDLTDTETRNLTDKNTVESTDTETRDTTDNRAIKTGAQENNTSDEGSENYNLRRKGNIGVMTQSDVLMKHLELWDSYAFYQKIFADIADLLLYV